MLFYNLVHFSGDIYDNVIALIDIIRFGDPTQVIYWKYLGFYIGSTINMVFYMPEDFLPYVAPKLMQAKDFPFRKV
jgi:hypothetical protein